MAKKKTKKQRKRHHLKANPKRQAHAQLKGYLYQIWHSVDAWLDLADDEVLYLEGAEDFDKISGDTATATQVKHTQHNITLRSQEVNDAINNYWELRTNNPGRKVKFRFLTHSQIGAEQGSPFGKNQRGLRLWSHCSGNEETITKISKFLQIEATISEEVNDFLKRAEPQQIYGQLIEPITWETGSKGTSFVEESIKARLIYHGDRYCITPPDAQKVFDSLITEAFRIATQKENRKLTKKHFLKIFAENTRVSVPIQNIHEQQPIALQVVLNHIKKALIADSSDITIQSQSPIQDTIPPLYHDVVPRTDLLAKLQAKLQSEGMVVIHGGTGKGKTTLAKLTVDVINGSWVWLNFTGRDSFQTGQLLRELTTEVSNQSPQVNIVLDDLNLQPQQLREYEEVLGIVVYRVLKRGAKLLITSQRKLPNYFSHRLDVLQSVNIDVPDLTISEIEQLAQQLGCPVNDVEAWAKVTQAQTGGHPMLVHALFAQLQQGDWKRDIIESILHPPQELADVRETARQLLIDLPEDQRELLYRLSLMSTKFRKDYVLNIGEIPTPISYPGDIFTQLIGPWVDPAGETYYRISPLLNKAAEQVWSKNKVNKLHAQIADAILKTKDLTMIEAQAILCHSMFGQNKKGLIAVIGALMTAPEDNWKEISQEFSWLIRFQTNPSGELFPGETFVNYLFRSFQYRIAVEIEPEFAPKILEIWDKETKPHEPRQSYLLSRLMLATQALRYNQVLLPAKQMINYIKEIINIKDRDKEVQEVYDDFMRRLEEQQIYTANFFSLLFSFILVRRPIYAPFLSELIDGLDELDPKMRSLILADFEEDSVDSRILIDGVWLAEAKLENPDWTRCFQVFDKVIERVIAWNYPHIAAASARGKAIIYDEYLHSSDTAHKVLQDILSKLGPLPAIEEEQAMVHFRQKHYREALNIYERILPEWHPSSKKLDLGPLEGYRRAAICAAHLDDWEKAAILFEDGAKRAQRTEGTEMYIGLYADAGFAQFKAGNMLDSIKLFNLALQKFEMLPPDSTNINYFTLKKRLGRTIGWMAGHERESYPLDFEEPSVGFCSNLETNEKVLTLPDSPIGYSWLHLAQIEYNFGLGTTALENALQTSDRDSYPALSYFLSFLETQYDFRNKTFDNLPQRIYQLAEAYGSTQRHDQSGKGIDEKGIYSISVIELSSFASIENITGILATALLVQLPTGIDTREILAIWRSNSSQLPIKDNMVIALDLIESMLSADKNKALTVMKTKESKYEERFLASLKIVLNIETKPEDLFYAHTLITTALTSKIWEDLAVTGLAELLSAQWLEKIKFRATLKMPMITVPQIEQACTSSETGKKKIGQILLAVYQAVSIRVAPEILQQFRSWSE